MVDHGSPVSDPASPEPASRSGPGMDETGRTGKEQPQNKKRSARACLSCRARKVRCNVALHGAPCTNCRLDEVECVVKPRTRKWHLAAALAAEAAAAQQKGIAMLTQQRQQPLSAPINDNFSLLTDAVGSNDLNGLRQSVPPQQQQQQQQQPQQPQQQQANFDASFRPDNGLTDQSFFSGPELSFSNAVPMEENDFLTSLTDGSLGLDGGLDDRSDTQFQFPNFNLEQGSGTGTELFSMPTQPALTARPGAFMLFSCYPFIEADSLYRLAPEDATFLEQRGCFHIPTRTILDEFMQQYFLHIHPIFPLLNERDFWAAYSARTPGQARIPLFLIQAMLFTASPYVQFQTLRTLGFPSVKQARAKFYSKAKALFDTDPYRDDTISAQGALMLTYHAPTTNASISTYWLSTAVHFARSARADQFDTFAEGNNNSPQGLKTATILKRLWWCCIMRDRIMSLGLRRPLHISATDIDVNLPGFTERDFADEIRTSPVYNPATKQILVQIAVSFSELCPVLNDALAVLYPTRSGAALEDSRKNQKIAMDCLARLDRWHARTVDKFQVPKHVFGGAHESLTLFTNMMYIYHYTAKAALCNKLIFISIADDAVHDDNEEQRRLQVQAEMDRSLRGITDGFMDLEALGLVKFLTNTFVAFSAFPFIWHILDAKLLESETTRRAASAAEAKRDLKVYANVMRGFRQLYESTDDVLQCIERTVQHVKLNELLQSTYSDTSSSPTWESLLSSTSSDLQQQTSPMSTASGSSSSTAVATTGKLQRSGNAWVDLLVGKPQSYVRIALTVDLSLSRGQVPSENDFPKALQALCRSRRHDVLSAAAVAAAGGEAEDMGFYECLQQAFGAGAAV